MDCGIKVLVCGGRNFNGDVSVLSQLNISILISGGCSGADSLAHNWARAQGIHTAQCSALWKVYGKSAGMRRNQIMLLLEPDICVAFPGGRGTENMVKLAQQTGIEIWKPLDSELLQY